MKKEAESKSGFVWMDHHEAKFIDSDKSTFNIRVITSPYEKIQRIDGESSDGVRLGNYRSTNNEFSKNAIKINGTNKFFKKLANELKSYNEIYIFGPTNAHKEFHNYLLKERKYQVKSIKMNRTDYLTDNQLIAFAKNTLS